MKKFFSLFIVCCFSLSCITACLAEDSTYSADTISLWIDRPVMVIDNERRDIDNNGTAPIVKNDRTLIPVRAITEAMGGNVLWEEESQTVTLTNAANTIVLVIGSTTAYLNNEAKTLDTAPIVINDRTMLPIRFIAEAFGYVVDWDKKEQHITITNQIFATESPAVAPSSHPVTYTDAESISNEYKVKLTAGNREFTATLYKNATTDALVEKLPLTLPMKDLYGREMCYRFSDALPTDDAGYSGYEVGEIIYWPPGHSFVILYKQNGEEFEMQKLGRIDNSVEFFETSGDIDLTIELIDNTSDM